MSIRKWMLFASIWLIFMFQITFAVSESSEKNYFLGVESTTYHNRPAFLLMGTKDLRIKDTVLTQPDRLVLDLPGVTAHFAIKDQIETAPFSMVKQVLFDQSNTGSLKIIFALNKAIGYQLIPLPDQPNRVILVFNYLVEDVNIFQQDEESKILISYTAPAEYQIKTINSNHLTLSFKRSPLVHKTIVIDPGHGGEDSGAWGRQIQEKEVNLEIAMRLKEQLEAAGAAVVLTRTDDYFVGLYERSFLANYLSADLFISIHTNNHPDLSVHGIEVFNYPDRNAAHSLAQNVLAKITQYTGLVSLGVKQENFVVIRESLMPSILVEVGFLSNFQEENIIKTPEFKDNAAMGIYQGILDYYSTAN